MSSPAPLPTLARGARTGAALLALGTLALLAPTGLAAQSLRTYSAARQLHGETRLVARVDYAAGTLRVAPAAPGDLYRLRLTYDEQRYRPVGGYDASSGTAALGIEPLGGAGLRLAGTDASRQLATLGLSADVDLALDLTLGAVEGDVELGGLRLTSLRVNTGASRTVLHFSEPNSARCAGAEFRAGAAELAVVGLGNSRCDAIRVQGGMGSVILDFSGHWTTSTRVTVAMRVGELTLRLPRSAGVRLTLDKFLASFQPVGLAARGTTYLSPNYARAPRHLDIDLTTAVGAIKVEWVD